MKLTLTSKQEVVPSVVEFWWDMDEPITWKPGQFLKYNLPHNNPDNRGTNRFFTIASAPEENKVLLTTRFTPNTGSSFKHSLYDLNPGATIEANGPSGSFIVEDPNLEYVFIAGGIGITPFRSILMHHYLINQPLKVTLLYANRNQDIVFKDEFDKISQSTPDLKIHYMIDPQKIDEAAIRQYVPNLENLLFYVSGPEPMVESMSQMLKELGVSKNYIKQDFFPGYQA